MRKDFIGEIAAVRCKLFVRKRFIAADRLSVNTTERAAFAQSVLHAFDLHVEPVCPKRIEYAAVMGHVTIPVRGAFPDAHRGEMWRLQ
jgi:hypothetical protein